MTTDNRLRIATPTAPPPTLAAAIRIFNAGDYFACHEILEELWLDEAGPLRELYKGILQIGIGVLHLQRGNLKGAGSLLRRGSELIAPFAPSAFGIDLEQLGADARLLLQRLGETPPPTDAVLTIRMR